MSIDIAVLCMMCCYLRPPSRPAQGFTLIELITVIVILGVLAAMALPKFMDMQREARIAKLQGLQAALKSAANQAYALCKLQHQQCDESKGHIQAMPGTGLGPKVTAWGVDINMQHGWPTPFDGYGIGAGFKSITSTVNAEGFLIHPYVGSSFEREFHIADAPDPANCKVTYRTWFWTAGNVPTYVIASTGC
ncbi:MAG: type II secretion system protein [Ideonella sp.]|nr:type II secretion system protein [Ideonella sp.]